MADYNEVDDHMNRNQNDQNTDVNMAQNDFANGDPAIGENPGFERGSEPREPNEIKNKPSQPEIEKENIRTYRPAEALKDKNQF